MWVSILFILGHLNSGLQFLNKFLHKNLNVIIRNGLNNIFVIHLKTAVSCCKSSMAFIFCNALKSSS